MEETNLQKIAEDNIRVNALLNAAVHDVEDQTKSLGTQIEKSTQDIGEHLKKASDIFNDSVSKVFLELHKDLEQEDEKQEMQFSEETRQLEALKEFTQNEFSQVDSQLKACTSQLSGAAADSQKAVSALIDRQTALINFLSENISGQMFRSFSELKLQYDVSNKKNKKMLIASIILGSVDLFFILILLALR